MTADKKICDDCGKIHVTHQGSVACRAHLTGSGKTIPCKNAPIRGGSVCRIHGGSLKKTQMAAQERLALMSAKGEIGQLMRECDIPEQHPADGLLEVVRVSGAMMRLYATKVGELDEDPVVREVLVEGKDGSLTTKFVSDRLGLWGLDKDGEMVNHIYVNQLRVWSERYERACKTALEAGIEERKLRLAEDTSDLFFRMLSLAMVSAGFDDEARQRLQLALATELRKTQDILEVNTGEAA